MTPDERPFHMYERVVLSCLFDGNYWSPEELHESVVESGGVVAALPDVQYFLNYLETNGWVEQLDDEEPRQYRRVPDEPEDAAP